MINLHNSKTKMQKYNIFTNKQRLTTLFIAGLLMVGFAVSPLVQADNYDDQINAINQQNAQHQANLDSLSVQATSLADQISKLQERINVLQSQINENTAQRDTLNRQIVEAEAELARQKAVLGENIRAMYLEGEITTFEILLSSKDLHEFVDKEQYRNSVKSQITATLDRINLLKAQLATQKETVEKLLAEQQRMQGEQTAQQAEQNRLLAMNQSQQAAIDNQIRANYAQVSELRAAQAAAYARATGGGRRNYGSLGNFQFRNQSGQSNCGGGYSYCWAYYDQYVNDSWGLNLARECVHYAADRAARGRDLSRYLGAYWGAGNATNWPTSLDGAPGVTINRAPAPGSVAIVNGDDLGNGYGHAMYVESILGDGWVRVSQMNWGGPGTYSTMEVKASGLWFVHFN